VYQFVGVGLFLVMMFVCCGSALVSKDKAESRDLTMIGWRLPGQASDAPPAISAQRAIAVAVPAGVAMGLALASIGLGLQAQRRGAPWWACGVAGFSLLFWLGETIFAASVMRSVGLSLIGLLLTVAFGVLLVLAISAWREMRRDPPPVGHEILPADYKVPYSHMHQDPPDVRLARELEQRRERLAVQQKELELIEARLRRTIQKPKPQSNENDTSHQNPEEPK
jgi:hypothetical protein